MTKINNILNEGFQTLKKSSIKSSKLDSELILAHVLKKNLKYLILNDKDEVTQDQIFNYKNLITRRSLGEPVAYILKSKEFWKNSFYVDRNTLIPRPDTEILIEESLRFLKRNDRKLVLDIGTGSGCIIITLIKEFPKLMGSAIDISKFALKVAKINAKIHQCENRIKFYQSSVDNFFKGKYDLIISNPPYINNYDLKYLDRDIINFEPLLSLRGGYSGLSVLKKVIKRSSDLIKAGGKLILEIGYDQKYEVIKCLKDERFYVNKLIKDYADNYRCVIATKYNR